MMLTANVYDIFKWVERNIKSCVTLEQLLNCNKLINNFQNLYSENIDECFYLRNEENIQHWFLVQKKAIKEFKKENNGK